MTTRKSARYISRVLAFALVISLVPVFSVVLADSVPTFQSLYDQDYLLAWGNDFSANGTPFTLSGSGSGTGEGLLRETDTYDGQSNGYLRHWISGQSGERSRAGTLPTAVSGTKIYVNFDYRAATTPASNSAYGVTFYDADGVSALFTLLFLRDGPVGAWTGFFPDGNVMTTAGYTSHENWTRIGTANNSTSTWYTIGVEFDFSTQTAAVTIRQRADTAADWMTGTLFGTATVPIEGSGVTGIRLGTGTRPSGTAQTANFHLDNLYFFYKTVPSETIMSIVPFPFLPQLPEGNTSLKQSRFVTKYAGEVESEAGLGLPATVDVVTKAGTTHTLNISGWSLTETPRGYTGTAFDPAVTGVWGYTAAIEEIPGVAVNHLSVPVRLYFDLRTAPTGMARSAEWLDRGVVALPVASGYGAGMLVKWRVLADEYERYGASIAFNVYRDGEKVNADPIVAKQNYIDADGKAGDKYQVELIQTGDISEESAAWAQNHLAIGLQRPAQRTVTGTSSSNNQTITYVPNDCAAADVDGDGQYEILVKWESSSATDPGTTAKITGETIYDCYDMDGNILWRICLGHNLSSGQHYNMRHFYDVDESGKANFAIKTAVGTRVFQPKADGTIDDLIDTPVAILASVDDSNAADATPEWRVPTGPVDHQTGYKIYTYGISGTVATSGTLGRVSTGPEYFTVFDGETGLPVDTVPHFAPYGKASNWGDSGNNRSDRYGATIAYLPYNGVEGERPYPSMIEIRGQYGPHFVAAYQLIDGKIVKIWEFALGASAATNPSYGAHYATAADIDYCGYDEIVFGSLVLNHDGTIRWRADGTRGSLRGGHGDAVHLSVMSPYTNDFWIMTPQEAGPPNNVKVYNASTGEGVWAYSANAGDVGRGVAANITSLPGFEVWASSTPIHNLTTGKNISSTSPSSTNFRVYWDGDLLDELLDSNSVRKYNYNVDTGAASNSTLITMSGTTSNNGTKSTPGLAADIFGDWREELIMTVTSYTELRIYSTDIPTDYLIYTLTHDPTYRLAINAQGNIYNQPSHLGFYLGEDIKDKVLAMELQIPNLVYTNAPSDRETLTLAIDGRIVSLVSGYAANIPVTVTAENADGLKIYAGLYVDGNKIAEAEAVDGKAVIRAPRFTTDSANVYVKAWFEGSDPEIEKAIPVAQADGLWAPAVTKNSGTIYVAFASEITFSGIVTVNGSKAETVTLSDNKKTLAITGYQASVTGIDKVVVSGVKYPDLFPSYSFTFTLDCPN